MIVHEPEIDILNGEIIIKSRIETIDSFSHFPKYLTYTFPEKISSTLMNDNNGFAVSAIMLAMFYNEPLEIRGKISEKLAYGLFEYVKVFNRTYPKLFNPIKLKFEKVEKIKTINQTRWGGVAFSGGVDSTFSVWNLLNSIEEKLFASLKYGIFIHGFDIEIKDEAGFNKLSKKYQDFFSSLGLELIPVKTNYRDFTSLRISWVYVHGNPLYAFAHFLSNQINKFFIPSTYTYDNPTLTGTSFLVDHLMSTEATEIVHHGAGHSIYDKLEVLKEWPPSYDQLRVCSNKKISAQQNCGKCNKCLRTMMFLETHDTYSSYTLFKKKFSSLDILRWGLADYGSNVFKLIFISKSIEKKRYWYVILGYAAMVISLVHKISRALILNILPKKFILKIKQKIYS